MTMTLQEKQSSDQAFWVNKTDANNKKTPEKTKNETKAMNNS